MRDFYRKSIKKSKTRQLSLPQVLIVTITANEIYKQDWNELLLTQPTAVWLSG